MPASRVLVLLGGFIFLASCHLPAGAQPLPPPRTFNDVPPPSNSQPVTDPSPVPPAAPNEPTKNRVIDFNRPLGQPSTPSSSSALYRVYIEGDSSQLLQQVRQLDSTAFVRRGEGIIQAGLYADELKAQQRARELEALGIKAIIVQLSNGAPNSASLNSATPESSNSASSTLTGSYFAVIPGSRADLANIAVQVIKLGISQDYVRTREAPRGPHVAVGPFEKRGQAESWSIYLRAYGMDARVYYGR